MPMLRSPDEELRRAHFALRAKCGGAGNRTRVQSGDQHAFYVCRQLNGLSCPGSKTKTRNNADHDV